MSKAMLILNEMPKGCFDCPCSTVIEGKCYLCEVTYDTESDGGKIMESCPLRPLPKHKKGKKG